MYVLLFDKTAPVADVPAYHAYDVPPLATKVAVDPAHIAFTLLIYALGRAFTTIVPVALFVPVEQPPVMLTV